MNIMRGRQQDHEMEELMHNEIELIREKLTSMK